MGIQTAVRMAALLLAVCAYASRVGRFFFLARTVGAMGAAPGQPATGQPRHPGGAGTVAGAKPGFIAAAL